MSQHAKILGKRLIRVARRHHGFMGHLTKSLAASAAAGALVLSAPWLASADTGTDDAVVAALRAAGVDLGSEASLFAPQSRGGEGEALGLPAGWDFDMDLSGSTAIIDQGEVLLAAPTPESDGAVVDGSATTIFSTDAAPYSAAIVQHVDHVQMLTVIQDSAAPSRYAYEFGGAVASLELVEGGVVVVRDEGGATLGFSLPAWATDAAGREVATRYEVDGTTLTQVVDHDAADVQYPVVADPTYSGKVFTSAFMSDYSASIPGRKLSITVSAYGRQLYVSNTPLFKAYGWNLITADFSGYLGGYVGTSIEQQYSCHILGGLFEWGTWDLETGRPSNPNWQSRIGMSPVSATCNW